MPDEVDGVWNTVFLAVKALHTEAAAKRLAPRLAADGVVVSLQNGFNELVIADVVGRERTLGAFINFGADVVDPGVVHFAGRGAVVVGELDGRSTERLARVHARCSSSSRRRSPPTTSGAICGARWGTARCCSRPR